MKGRGTQQLRKQFVTFHVQNYNGQGYCTGSFLHTGPVSFKVLPLVELVLRICLTMTYFLDRMGVTLAVTAEKIEYSILIVVRQVVRPIID